MPALPSTTISRQTVLQHMEIPGHAGFFLLGALERRVTVLSQQVRAHNLIYALFAEQRLAAGDAVAIVGGGAAGMTAAAAAVLCGAKVTLLEQGQLLGLLAKCHTRWVHPHIYDWPYEGTTDPETTELELLGWRADTASKVAEQIRDGFDAIRNNHADRLRVIERARNIQATPGGLRWGPGDNREPFKVVIIAVGFGIEKTIKPLPLKSYWRNEDLDQDPLTRGRKYLVSGTGDGGLTDLLRVCIGRFEHHRMLQDFGLSGDEFQRSSLATELKAIEEEARRTPNSAELVSRRYRALAAPWVDEKIKQRLSGSGSRHEASVVLNGTQPDPFDLHASVLNRFLASRLLHLEAADYRYGELKSIKPLSVKATHRYAVTFGDDTVEEFDHIVVRHGADSALRAGFPGLAQSALSLRSKNDLDQTRAPLWPPGWFRERLAPPLSQVGASREPPASDAASVVTASPSRFGSGVSTQATVPPTVVVTATSDAGPTPPHEGPPSTRGAQFSVQNRPFNVPFAPKGNQMVGDQDVLQQVRNKLTASKRSPARRGVALQGIGGLGKTQTAVEYAYVYKNQYPGGVIWLFADQDLDSQLTQLATDARWLAPESDAATKLDVARQRLRSHAGCLFIFDNLEDPRAIEAYLSAAPRDADVLVTSQLEQPGFESVPLDLLPPPQSLTLLLQEADRLATTGPELEAASKIVKELDGLPLALELAGAYLRQRPEISFQTYLEQLLNEGLRTALRGKFLVSATAHEADLFRTLRISKRLLIDEPQLQSILRVMSQLAPASLGIELLSALLKEPRPSALTDALSLATKLRILSPEHGPVAARRYRMHRLIWAVLQEEQPTGDADARALGQRLCSWLMALRDDPAKVGQYEAEVPHLAAWTITCQQHHWDEDLVRSLWLQAYPLYHRGQYRESEQVVTAACRQYDERGVNNEELLAHLQSDLGTLNSAQGRYTDALKYAEKALAIRQRLFGEEHRDTATSLNNVGVSHGEQGNHAKALEYVEKALAIRQRVLGEEHRDTATSWNNVGYTYGKHANHANAPDYAEKALDYVKKALAMRRRMLGEEHPETAASWNNLGYLYGEQGDSAKALKYQKEALAIVRRVLGEDHPHTATCWNNVGSTYGQQGDHDQAQEYKEEAWAMRRRVLGEEHPDTASSWYNVGVTYGEQGKQAKALECHDKAHSILSRTLGSEHPTTMRVTLAYVQTLCQQKQALKARDVLEKALARVSAQSSAHKALRQAFKAISVPGFRKTKRKK